MWVHKICGFDPWAGKIPWSRKRQPAPAFLPGKFHGPREPGGLQSIGSQSQARLSNWAQAWAREGFGVAAVWYMSVKSESEVFLQQKKDDWFPQEAFGVIYFSLWCRPRRQSISLSFLAVTVLGAHGEFLHRVGPYPVICSGSLVFCML